MSFELIDTHCHVHFRAYANDMDEVVERTLEQGVAMITVGTQSKTSADAVDLARQYEGVWASIGLHPNHVHAQEFVDENELDAQAVIKTRSEHFDADLYRELASDPNVVAIGETGLDYFRIPDGYEREQVIADQKLEVKAQFAFADSVQKPVIIHCRDAHEDQATLIEDELRQGRLEKRGVIHCFTGNVEDARRYEALGFSVSLTGILIFSKELQKVVKDIPLSQIMIETDSPYLTPPPHRGKRNEPAYVRFIAEALADIKGISYEEVARVTSENAARRFGITL